jgi:hypothetical protein
MHGIYQTEAFLYPAFLNCLLYLRRDINEFLPILGIKPEILRIGFHLDSNPLE